PGEITALMGDHYGVFDEDGKLNVRASFDQMSKAPREEMDKLLEHVHDEQAGNAVTADDWEKAEAGRKGKKFAWTDPETGEKKEFEQLSYVDLAKRNNAHFSGRTMEEGNMGAYSELHRMALEEAQKPEGERDLDKVRALEAASDHYLTDRHCGGHT